jgi:hypothetical protein
MLNTLAPDFTPPHWQFVPAHWQFVPPHLDNCEDNFEFDIDPLAMVNDFLDHEEDDDFAKMVALLLD